MAKKFYYTRGVILDISDIRQVRRPKMADIFKRYLSVKIHDRNEIVHLEIRNSGLKLIDHLDLDKGVEILFTYEFQGVSSTKDGYTSYINNVVITQIKKYIPNSQKQYENSTRKPVRFSR